MAILIVTALSASAESRRYEPATWGSQRVGRWLKYDPRYEELQITPAEWAGAAWLGDSPIHGDAVTGFCRGIMPPTPRRGLDDRKHRSMIGLRDHHRLDGRFSRLDAAGGDRPHEPGDALRIEVGGKGQARPRPAGPAQNRWRRPRCPNLRVRRHGSGWTVTQHREFVWAGWWRNNDRAPRSVSR